MKALALVDSPDHVCCRYRLRAFEPAVRAAGGTFVFQGLARGILDRGAQLIRVSASDIVVLQRKLLPFWQLSVLRRRARRLVFDFDDAVLYRDSYDRRGVRSPSRARRFAWTVRAADLVIAGNDFLADCALRAGARPENVQVIPTCVDTDRNTPADPGTPVRPGLELVWIGSSSTLQGLERRRDLWERVGREVPGVRLRVICDRFPAFEGLPVVAVPWSEATEGADLAAADVGIAWVPDDDWSRGKCGLKVLQYQAAGLPVVANPVGVHGEMIAEGVSGFLAATDDQWVAALRALAADADLRRRMVRAARASVVKDYSVGAWSSTFVASLAGPGASGSTAAHLARVRPRARSPHAESPHARSLRARPGEAPTDPVPRRANG